MSNLKNLGELRARVVSPLTAVSLAERIPLGLVDQEAYRKKKLIEAQSHWTERLRLWNRKLNEVPYALAFLFMLSAMFAIGYLALSGSIADEGAVGFYATILSLVLTLCVVYLFSGQAEPASWQHFWVHRAEDGSIFYQNMRNQRVVPPECAQRAFQEIYAIYPQGHYTVQELGRWDPMLGVSTDYSENDREVFFTWEGDEEVPHPSLKT